jgi:CheY-like chemotaxis protein
VRDLGSRNGTFLNGERLENDQPVLDGDRFSLAHLHFEIQFAGAVGTDHVTPGAGAGQAAGSPRQSHHVLVVEDNAVTAETLARLLEAWGLEVDVAHDGPEAIDVAKAHPPDTVLLDIELPGMDGCEVAQRLRTQPGLENARLVAITRNVHENVRRRTEEAGFNHFLAKPVDAEVLHDVLSCAG